MPTIQVKVSGFAEIMATLRRARERLPGVISEELQTFGQEGVDYLQEKVRSNSFDLLPKRRNDGNPPLIHTENYINSYRTTLESPFSIGLEAVGMNERMSNQDLAELLEYGNGEGIPARPHLRPTAAWMMSRTNVLGHRIVERLFK